MTALDLAVEEGHEDVAELLLEQCPYMAQSEKEVWLLAAKLQRAVKVDDEQSLRTSLEEWQGSQHDWYLGRVLWKAAQEDNEALVKMLLHRGADPNTVHYGRSVLYVAGSYNALQNPTVKGNFATLELLISYGANVDAPGEKGEGGLLLCYAVREGYAGLVRFLVEAGADVNLAASDGPTPVYEAIWNQEAEILGYLLEQGADVNYIGHPKIQLGNHLKPEETTALDVAIIDSSPDDTIVNILRKHGGQRANIDAMP